MRSCHEFDRCFADRLGMIVRDRHDARRGNRSEEEASTHDVNALAATKRLMISGRRDAALDAIKRELMEMQALRRPR